MRRAVPSTRSLMSSTRGGASATPCGVPSIQPRKERRQHQYPRIVRIKEKVWGLGRAGHRSWRLALLAVVALAALAALAPRPAPSENHVRADSGARPGTFRRAPSNTEACDNPYANWSWASNDEHVYLAMPRVPGETSDGLLCALPGADCWRRAHGNPAAVSIRGASPRLRSRGIGATREGDVGASAATDHSDWATSLARLDDSNTTHPESRGELGGCCADGQDSSAHSYRRKGLPG